MIRQNGKISKAFAELQTENQRQLLQCLGVASVNEVTLKTLHTSLRSKRVSAKMKEHICSLLFSIESKKSTRVLLDVFKNDDGGASHMAVLALSVITSDKALSELTNILQTSPKDSLRQAAAYCLMGYFGDERAVEALIQALADRNQSSATRAQAAEGLGTLSATRATKLLLENLHDKSLEVRYECVWALGQVSMDAAIIPKLEKFLGDHTKCSVLTMHQEASESIKFVKARVIALENYKGDKSTADIWSIHSETLALAREMEKASKKIEK